MTAQMTVPANRAPRQTSIAICVLCLAAGLCLTAAGIAIAVEFSRAEIHLRRESGTVTGTMRWMFLGAPVFRRSLDGLARVEREDYRTRESANGGGHGQLRNVARVVFRDRQGRQLAWAERTAIINEAEPLQRFLQQATTDVIEADSATASPMEFTFVEPPRATTWDRIQAAVIATVFVGILTLAGFVCVLAGVLSLYQRIVPMAA